MTFCVVDTKFSLQADIFFLSHSSYETKLNLEDFFPSTHLSSQFNKSVHLSFLFLHKKYNTQKCRVFMNMLLCVVFAGPGDPDLLYTNVIFTQEVEQTNRMRGRQRHNIFTEEFAVKSLFHMQNIK